MPPRLVTKGDMTSRRVLSVVFKILKCTSHLGIGLVADQHLVEAGNNKLIEQCDLVLDAALPATAVLNMLRDQLAQCAYFMKADKAGKDGNRWVC